jgi:hypothetical protein
VDRTKRATRKPRGSLLTHFIEAIDRFECAQVVGSPRERNTDSSVAAHPFEDQLAAAYIEAATKSRAKGATAFLPL